MQTNTAAYSFLSFGITDNRNEISSMRIAWIKVPLVSMITATDNCAAYVPAGTLVCNMTSV